MKASDALRKLIEDAPGWSQNKMAKAIGIGVQAMSDRMRAKDQKTGFVAEVLDKLGYQLVIVPPQSTLPQGSIVIDPDLKSTMKSAPVKENEER